MFVISTTNNVEWGNITWDMQTTLEYTLEHQITRFVGIAIATKLSKIHELNPIWFFWFKIVYSNKYQFTQWYHLFQPIEIVMVKIFDVVVNFRFDFIVMGAFNSNFAMMTCTQNEISHTFQFPHMRQPTNMFCHNVHVYLHVLLSNTCKYRCLPTKLWLQLQHYNLAYSRLHKCYIWKTLKYHLNTFA